MRGEQNKTSKKLKETKEEKPHELFLFKIIRIHHKKIPLLHRCHRFWWWLRIHPHMSCEREIEKNSFFEWGLLLSHFKMLIRMINVYLANFVSEKILPRKFSLFLCEKFLLRSTLAWGFQQSQMYIIIFLFIRFIVGAQNGKRLQSFPWLFLSFPSSYKLKMEKFFHMIYWCCLRKREREKIQ